MWVSGYQKFHIVLIEGSDGILHGLYRRQHRRSNRSMRKDVELAGDARDLVTGSDEA
jgi:hypothetical protein